MDKLSCGEVGAISELKACIWLLSLGYEVYRNVTPNGNFDIIAIKGNEIKKIDVTTANHEKVISRKKQDRAKNHNGHVLYVFPDSSCKWDWEHDPIFEKKLHTCIVCSIKFESYDLKRTTCGSRECQVKLATIKNHKKAEIKRQMESIQF